MDISPIVLRETKTTRLLFFPYWVSKSDNPLRGGFRFQRKGKNDSWKNIDHKTLSSLKKDEGYELNLDGGDMAQLFGRLEEIKSLLSQHGHSYGTRFLRLNEENAESILLQIGQTSNRDLIIKRLKHLESEHFENLGLAFGRAKLENAIEKFEANMGNTAENFWQQFFSTNPWILHQIFAFPVIYLNGETYLGGKNSRGRQGAGGTATDFLLKNGSNGSFAVVEIKIPNCALVGTCYRGIEGSGDNNELYRIHGDLSGSIVQLENQILTAMEQFKSILGEDYRDMNCLNPTGVLIAGNYAALTEMQRRSFDLFRKSLGKNQVYTFDELLMKLKLLKTVYES